MTTPKLLKFAAVLASLSAASAGLFLTSASAQTAPAASTTDVTTLEKFEVTGSYLPQAALAPTVPVTVLSAKDIEATGVNSNLLEVLKKTMPQLAGNTNLGTNNANVGSGSTNGGAQVELRNLPTLVLINGRRAPFAGVAARGGYEFVDLNLIPLAAIERVEVVTDGASALYGSDAVSGVVNIVMKTDYQGLEVGGGYGYSPNQGNWAERHGHLVAGVSNGKTSISVSGDWYRSDPLFQFERAYSNPIYGTSTFAGVIVVGSSYYLLNPSLNAPPAGHLPIATLVANGVYAGPYTSTTIQPFFNLANKPTLLGRNERKSATLAFSHKINDKLTAFGDFIASSTSNFSQLNGQPISATLAATDPNNPTDGTIVAANRFINVPRMYFFDTNALRGVIGLKGTIDSNWSWEAAANYGENRQNSVNPGLIATSARITAVASGLLDLTARINSDAALQAVVGSAYVNYLSKLATYDVLVRGKLFELPAGNVNMAGSLQVQRESLSLNSDRNSNVNTFGWDSGVSITPSAMGRNVYSEVLELQVPLISKSMSVPVVNQLDFDGAVRHDDYSRVQKKSTVPKYSIRWQPFGDELVVRGTFSKSFAAPSLYSLYGPSSLGFTSVLTVPGYNSSGVATGVTASGQANSRGGSNLNLTPETSENTTAGFVYSPKKLKGFSIAIDYFRVNRYGVIYSGIGATTILRDVEKLGAASLYASHVKIGPGGNSSAYFDTGNPITAPGQVTGAGLDHVYVNDQTINLGAVKVSGADMNIKYTFNVEKVGKFTINNTLTAYRHWSIRSLPTNGFTEYSNYVSGNFNTIPDWRTYTTFGYTRGKFSAQIAHTYVPSLYDYSGVEGVNTHVNDYTQYDLQAAYIFGSEVKYLTGLTVTLGMDDVFNKFGPTSPSNTDAHIDTGLYGALGRRIYGSFSYKF